MQKARAAHPWIARYCIRTLQLMPTLPMPVVIRWAVSGFPYCGDDEPERAAERFVDHHRAGGKAVAPAALLAPAAPQSR